MLPYYKSEIECEREYKKKTNIMTINETLFTRAQTLIHYIENHMQLAYGRMLKRTIRSMNRSVVGAVLIFCLYTFPNNE